MNIVAEIQKKLINEQFEFSRHALDRTIIRMISVQEIREMIQQAELLEDYPDDKYGQVVYYSASHRKDGHYIFNVVTHLVP